MALRLQTDPAPEGPEEKRAELTEHLAELRTRLIRACVYCAVGMVVMYILSGPVYTVLSAPVLNAIKQASAKNGTVGGGILFTSFTEPFFLKLQISMVGGLVIAAPFILLELWGFISPALTPTEKRAVTLVAPMSVLLFIAGVSCAFFILPMAVHWFLSYLSDIPGAVLFQNPLTYVVFVIKLMLVFGILFQLPVLLTFLGKVGLITSAMMIKYWRQIAVGLFTVSMVVAPSNDPGTMLALAVPLTILFFVSILLVKWVEPKTTGS
ncbi:MAG: twin-arginine translocase subunit TatC [Capsulimonas sp.]|jgi:sec-independent protein translocase protein TatC|uniref:twin-arginine translocase subunit TatC n=1 Tax=Capsulimonas sp. TaxID=2494211 RepID=UPI003266B230|nr:twin arginine-targeting protein translocase TatC [Capsulimonas sp.]